MTQHFYQPANYQAPQPWYTLPPYSTPAPQAVFIQQPRQQNHDGFLALFFAAGLVITWLDSRRQKAEIRQLQQQVANLNHQISNRGIVMEQPLPIENHKGAADINGAHAATSFGDGTHFVGSNGVQPGIYRVAEPGIRYYVARLRNFSGQNAILANWNGVTPGIIEVLPTDAGVEARGGVVWHLVQPTHSSP